MTYQETAALGQSASGAEGARDGSASQELRQWTIKNLDASVVDKARAAAKRKGMKISAWVAATLENAADMQSVESDPSRNSLAIDLDEIVSKIEEIRREDRLLIERIEKDISQLVKGQHGMLTEMLSRSGKGRTESDHS
ncbi:hypothetical protein EN904_09980 [Mesorhizobium sp. M7A.F.Ca.CA.001.07.2.1]|uniref:hypothetical protein n=1 Tax=Mesorhizobium TaxID=68287 RepID=UPI000FCAF34C|nr:MULTISPECIES: hypothetical protein [Mesorhizobium]RVB44480.1 hypothetical protein EN918_05855 [Mesorhizobium sp. M7A.F.Ca.CA.004.05.1.1]MCF6124450.1 hypothetical protein [Mesorhizobium ciceri]MCQ8814462.1 hypothetical protein [Mesorhizobium sp. SEMIA396]RUX79067.1 hypothetical protein EN983_13615 [Mesorhizobium sp. M7A.F.Ca.CA.004.08.2.1]RUX89731.1 hypothetical protein EN982_00675 [Mesorhizobium sp. M7A.F.Ca.CA.004.08.1.1]